MDIIGLARKIGKEIQDDERFIEMNIAKQKTEEDELLQGFIGEFNFKKISINNEVAKEDSDYDKIQRLNAELKESYDSIITNENMIKFNEKKQSLDSLIRRVIAIITQSAEGEDPDLTDYKEQSCSGSCQDCSGCN